MVEKTNVTKWAQREDGKPLVHVLTVHWRSDQWIRIQLDYLREHLHSPVRMYVSLDELPRPVGPLFYFQTSLPGSHDEKLDHLAQMVLDNPETQDDDWLLFLDGDAFPIHDVTAWGRDKLARFPLAAVQRLENDGDPQPHPCFCLTTVGFWRDIGGTWRPGFTWNNSKGKPITDVGGDLLGILTRKELCWHPMLRSNRAHLHPVFFAVYDNLVYHHGAGFRKGCSRRAIEEKKEAMKGSFLFRLLSVLHRLFPGELLKPLRFRLSHEYWARHLAVRESQKLSRRVYREALSDHAFHTRL